MIQDDTFTGILPVQKDSTPFITMTDYGDVEMKRFHVKVSL